MGLDEKLRAEPGAAKPNRAHCCDKEGVAANRNAKLVQTPVFVNARASAGGDSETRLALI